MPPLLRLRFPLTVALVLAALVPGLLATPALTSAELYTRFREPETQSRPFVRWWWNGSRVREQELIRQVNALASAGIGGVEINTIRMPVLSAGVDLSKSPEVPWLSPEWCRLVRVTSEAARQRGLQTDLLVGSGWPLGGKFLPLRQQTQRVRVSSEVVRGPTTLRTSKQELLGKVRHHDEKTKDEIEPPLTELLFLRLVPADALTAEVFVPGHSLAMPNNDGALEINVPAGEHRLYIGLREQGFTHVKQGAPGADGPVLDHFSANAVRAYLDNMAAKLAPELGGKLGNHLRALFVDSVELDRANWTDDVPAEFSRRRGYELLPYLPFVLEPDDAANGSPFAQAVRHARTDFVLTLAELFQERFIGTFVTFCREQKVLARMQAYGRETDPLPASMQVDIPEGETWFWRDRKPGGGGVDIETTAVNKLVSSAAHLKGSPVTSFEAMTSPVVPFKETLADFKLATDLTFLDGLNHPILHGYNYSPPEAGFPGWVRYGSFVSAMNPWWATLPRYSDYVARVGTVMRQATPRAEVAILPPRLDEWGRFGRLYQPFPEVRHPWYIYELGRAIQQAGNGSDYVSEQILQQAQVRDGALHYGPQSYRALIVADVQSIHPATVRALLAWAKNGGRIVVLGEPPSFAPGHDPRQPHADTELRALAGELMRTAGVRVEPHPAYLEKMDDGRPPSHQPAGNGNPLPVASYSALVPWARGVLDRAGVAPVLGFAPLSAHLSQAHYSTTDGELFFVANRSRHEAVATTLTVPDARGVLWCWDPETGERQPVRGDAKGGVRLGLAPQQSLILVLDRSTPAGEPTLDLSPAPLPPVVRAIEGPWQCELQASNAKDVTRLKLDTLGDLSQRPQTEAFGGVARYRTNVELTQPGKRSMLDLGTVHGASEVIVNGTPVGQRWYGRHLYEIAAALKPGRNEIEIVVRTPLANLVRSLRNSAEAQRWASWYELTPTGLAGPVVLRGE